MVAREDTSAATQGQPLPLASPSRLAACRSCGGSHLTTFLDLGSQPIANALIDEKHLRYSEPSFPLELAFCHDCALVQVTETIAPDVLFGHDYPYYSSVSPTLLAHSRKHVQRILSERELDADSLVVEVASNDGYLLSNFVEAGVPVLGIDPATGPVAAARERGVSTMQAYFGADLAQELAARQRADVMIANNVAAHVDLINDFIAGFAILLKDDGFARLEVAYLRDLIEKCEFDTIYHEHLFYHSITALEPLLSRHGLYLNDAERIDIHGGSLRITMSKKPGRSARLEELQREEATLRIGDLSYYLTFGARVEQLRQDSARIGAAAPRRRREACRLWRRRQRRDPPELHAVRTRGDRICRRREPRQGRQIHAGRQAAHPPDRNAGARPAGLRPDSGLEFRQRDRSAKPRVCSLGWPLHPAGAGAAERLILAAQQVAITQGASAVPIRR